MAHARRRTRPAECALPRKAAARCRVAIHRNRAMMTRSSEQTTLARAAWLIRTEVIQVLQWKRWIRSMSTRRAVPNVLIIAIDGGVRGGLRGRGPSRDRLARRDVRR
jgi:hypothetical protein